MRYLHTTVHVRDLDAAIAFFQEWTGLTVRQRFSAGPGEIAFLASGAGETAVELISAPGGAAFSGRGISLGFETDDAERDLARAQALGIALGPMVQPNPHVRFCFLSGPDGLTVQLVQNL